MGCRYCGNELPRLRKKLSDDGFCSSEHRQLFLESMQATMVSRLQTTRQRLQQYRRADAHVPSAHGGADAGSLRAEVHRRFPRDPFSSPAPLVGFRMPVPDAQLLDLPLSSDLALVTGVSHEIPLLRHRAACATVVCRPAEVAAVAADVTRRVIHARDVDFGAFRRNAQPPTLTIAACEGRPRALLRHYRMRPRAPIDYAIRLACEAPSLLHSGAAHLPRLVVHPRELAVLRAAAFNSAVPRVPLLVNAFLPPVPAAFSADGRLPGTIHTPVCAYPAAASTVQIGAPSLFLRFARPLLRPARDAGINGLECAAGDEAPLMSAAHRATLPGKLVCHGSPALLARFFRMRPRGATGAATPGFQTLQPAAAALSGAVNLGRLSAATAAPAPGSIERFLPPRLRAALLGATLADSLETGGEWLNALSALSRPSFPPVLHPYGAPVLLPRFYRIRPRPGVPARELSALQAIEPVAADSAWSQVSLAVLPSDLVEPWVPDPLDHPCCVPLPPVQDPRIAAFVPGAPESQAIANSTALPGLLARGPERVPVAVKASFRMRPRAGLALNDTAVQETMAGGTLAAAPACSLHVPMPLGEIPSAPAALRRCWRLRPAAVTCAAVSAFESISAGDPLAGADAGLPESRAGRGALAPLPLSRFFRMRSRGGAQDAGLAAEELGDSGAVLFPPATHLASLGGVHAAPAPPLLERRYRMRPRSGVSCTALSPFEPIPAGGAVVDAAAHVPAVALSATAVAPVLLSRLFRTLPRGGVPGAGMTAADLTDSGAATRPGTLQLASLGRIASTPAPPLLDRCYRTRPRSGVNDAALPSFDRRGPVETIASAAATTAALPVLGHGLIRPLAPPEGARPYRARPAAGRTSEDVRAYTAIESVADAAPPRSGAPAPGDPASAAAPLFLNRFYRMRPRGAVAAPPELQLPVTGARWPELGAIVPRAGDFPPGCAAPTVLHRLYRLRPRPGVTCPDVPDGHSIALAALEPSQHPAAPTCPGLVVIPSPLFHDRIYRASPRGGSRGDGEPRKIVCSLIEDKPTLVEPSTSKLAVALAGLSGPRRTFRLAPVPWPDLIHARNCFRAFRPYPAFQTAPEAAFPTLLLQPPARRESLASGLKTATARWLRPGRLPEVLKAFRHAPGRMKWVPAAALLLIVLVAYTTTRPATEAKANSPADSRVTAQPSPSLPEAVETHITTIRQEVSDRSAIDISDDFTSGLYNWEGNPEWATSWTYDLRGGVKPGALALFKPSLTLRNYSLEFTGQIENKALSCVFRAADTRNYYAVKLMVSKPGPLPTVLVVRYAVVDGKEESRNQVVLPATVYNDTIYRIRLNVKDQSYTLFVGGKVADVWSDDRLQSGGVGFFVGKGERARILGVRVTYQNDALGKVFSYLSSPDPERPAPPR